MAVVEMVDALAEPTRRVGVRFTGAVSLAMLGLWAGFFAPLQVLLPEQVAAIDPDGKIAALAIVTGTGAGIALVVNPVAGALSDRTWSRWGRRRPWVFGGGVLGAVALFALGAQSTLLGLTITWCCAQLCLNTLLAALIATVPDNVPARQRGLVSGLVGLAQPLGVAVGVAVVSRVVTSIVVGYDIVAVTLLMTTLAYVILVHETPAPRMPFEWARRLRIRPVA